MNRYAAQTSVPVEKSRGEIERTLARYGASSFMYGWDQDTAIIGFIVAADGERRQVRFKLPLPDKNDREFTHHARGRRTESETERRWEQASRQRWRALNLVVKAKLEAVESGIATFEEEFLAYIMLPDGETVGEWIAPQLDEAYAIGVMPNALRLALPERT